MQEDRKIDGKEREREPEKRRIKGWERWGVRIIRAPRKTQFAATLTHPPSGWIVGRVDTNPQDILLLLPSTLYNRSTPPFLSSRRIVVVVYPAFYPIYTSVHVQIYSFVHTDRLADTCMDRQQFLTKKPESPSPPPPLTPRTGVSGCDRHRRGIEMRGSKRGKHPAQWRAAREEWEHRPTVAQGGGYVLVTLRLDAPSTSPETTSTQRAPSQSRGKRSAFSAPRVRKLPNAEASVSFSSR